MSDVRLARILHRVAKMTASLLEKEYGLGDQQPAYEQQNYAGGVVVIRKKVLTTE